MNIKCRQGMLEPRTEMTRDSKAIRHHIHPKKHNFLECIDDLLLQTNIDSNSTAVVPNYERNNILSLTFTRGIKESTKSLSLICDPILHNDSTALSLTQVSSTVQRVSNGGSKT